MASKGVLLAKFYPAFIALILICVLIWPTGQVPGETTSISSPQPPIPARAACARRWSTLPFGAIHRP